jgi:hypothetical protein
MENNPLRRQPPEYDKAKILSEINLRECTPPTRERIKVLAKKKTLTIEEQIYLGAVRDYLKLDAHRRDVISSRPVGSYALRLERKREADRKRKAPRAVE